GRSGLDTPNCEHGGMDSTSSWSRLAGVGVPIERRAAVRSDALGLRRFPGVEADELEAAETEWSAAFAVLDDQERGGYVPADKRTKATARAAEAHGRVMAASDAAADAIDAARDDA